MRKRLGGFSAILRFGRRNPLTDNGIAYIILSGVMVAGTCGQMHGKYVS